MNSRTKVLISIMIGVCFISSIFFGSAISISQSEEELLIDANNEALSIIIDDSKGSMSDERSTLDIESRNKVENGGAMDSQYMYEFITHYSAVLNYPVPKSSRYPNEAVKINSVGTETLVDNSIKIQIVAKCYDSQDPSGPYSLLTYYVTLSLKIDAWETDEDSIGYLQEVVGYANEEDYSSYEFNDQTPAADWGVYSLSSYGVGLQISIYYALNGHAKLTIDIPETTTTTNNAEEESEINLLNFPWLKIIILASWAILVISLSVSHKKLKNVKFSTFWLPLMGYLVVSVIIFLGT